MNLINKEHIMFLQIGQQCRQIALTLNRRARGLTKVDAHLVGDDSGQRGLAQSRRTIEQYMIQRVATFHGGLDEDGQILLGLILPDIFSQMSWPQVILPVISRLLAHGYHTAFVYVHLVEIFFCQPLSLLTSGSTV